MNWNSYWKSNYTEKKVLGVNTTYPDVINDLLNVTNNKSKCIELGCGSGNYCLELIRRGRDCIASDLSEDAIKLTAKKGEILFGVKPKIKIVDVYDIPYKKNTFDLIFSDGLLEHLDVPKALKEIKRVLKPGGWVVSKVPSDSFLYKIIFNLIQIKEWRAEEENYSKTQWKKFFSDLGFKEIEIRKTGNLILALNRRLFKNKRLDELPGFGKIYFLIKARK